MLFEGPFLCISSSCSSLLDAHAIQNKARAEELLDKLKLACNRGMYYQYAEYRDANMH